MLSTKSVFHTIYLILPNQNSNEHLLREVETNEPTMVSKRYGYLVKTKRAYRVQRVRKGSPPYSEIGGLQGYAFNFY